MEKVVEKVASIAKKSPQATAVSSSIAIATSIAVQVNSDKQDPSKVMGTMIKTNPVTSILTSLPGVGEVLEAGLDDVLNPTDSDDLTDEQLKDGNFDGRIRVKDMDKFEKRMKKKETKGKTKEKDDGDK